MPEFFSASSGHCYGGQIKITNAFFVASLTSHLMQIRQTKIISIINENRIGIRNI
jgi:hypothetical protein